MDESGRRADAIRKGAGIQLVTGALRSTARVKQKPSQSRTASPVFTD